MGELRDALWDATDGELLLLISPLGVGGVVCADDFRGLVGPDHPLGDVVMARILIGGPNRVAKQGQRRCWPPNRCVRESEVPLYQAHIGHQPLVAWMAETVNLSLPQIGVTNWFWLDGVLDVVLAVPK